MWCGPMAAEQAEFGQAKVGEFQVAVVINQQVVWLHIAVDDAGAVQVVEPLHHFCEVLLRPLVGQRSECLDERRTVASGEVLHDQVQVLWALECEKQLDHEGRLCAVHQDHALCTHIRDLVLGDHVCLFENLDREDVAGRPFLGEKYGAIRPLADRLEQLKVADRCSCGARLCRRQDVWGAGDEASDARAETWALAIVRRGDVGRERRRRQQLWIRRQRGARYGHRRMLCTGPGIVVGRIVDGVEQKMIDACECVFHFVGGCVDNDRWMCGLVVDVQGRIRSLVVVVLHQRGHKVFAFLPHCLDIHHRIAHAVHRMDLGPNGLGYVLVQEKQGRVGRVAVPRPRLERQDMAVTAR